VVTELKTDHGAIAGEHAIPVTLSDEQKQQAAGYRAALEGLPKWLAERDQEARDNERLRIYLIAGGGAAVLLVLLIVLLMRRGRKRKAQEAERRQKEEEDKAEILAKIEREKEEREEQARLEAARRRVPIALLVAIDGPMRGSRFGIMGNTCTVGREATCDMVLPDKERGGDGSISRVHAQLAYDGQTWTLVSLADNNILRVGQTQLRKGDPRYPIQLGDRLIMGATTFELLKP
jgi:pSer/pThr/pTyr-binding forkhead associated (FHA) protein